MSEKEPIFIRPCPECRAEVIAKGNPFGPLELTITFRVRKGPEHETWCKWYRVTTPDDYAT